MDWIWLHFEIIALKTIFKHYNAALKILIKGSAISAFVPFVA